MERNLELVKQILEHFENKSDWTHETEPEISEYDQDLIQYHLQIMFEAGLVNCEPVKSDGGRIYKVIPFRLTWDGHEFLDNIKDNARWNVIKSKVKEKGGAFSFDLIKKLAIQLAQKHLFD